MAKRRNSGLGHSPDVHADAVEKLLEEARVSITYVEDPRSCRNTFNRLKHAQKLLTAARVHALAAPSASRRKLLDRVGGLQEDRLDKEANAFKKRCLKD